MAKQKTLTSKIYLLIAGSATVGLVASFTQAIQTINHYKFPDKPLSCDLNSVFNCNSVFDAWQSSFFGFSNSLLCIVFFTLILGIALAGLFGASIHKNLRLFAHFLVVFFLGFGAWYLWSSTYVIAALCIYCIFCYSAVILLNFAWLRLNIDDLPLHKNLSSLVKKAISNNYDIVFWVVWASVFVAMFYTKFA